MNKLYPEVDYKITYLFGDVCSLHLNNVVVVYEAVSARPYYGVINENKLNNIGYFGCISRDLKLINLNAFITTDNYIT